MSYAFLGHKWGPTDFGEAAGPVTWSADLSDLTFDDTAHDLSEFQTALEDAFQAWEDVAAIDFTQVAGPADVTVGVGTFDEPRFVGLTQWFLPDGPGLDTPEDMRLTFDLEETWSPGETGDGLNFYAVAAHEIGHVLGLDHVDDNSQLMWDLIGPTDLNTGDIEGAQILYGKDETDQDIGPIDAAPDPSEFDAALSQGGGGGGGGILVALLGLVGALFAGLFGGGGGLTGFGAAQSRSPEDAETMDAWGSEALDWMPTVPTVEDVIALPDDNDALDEDLLDWV